MSFADDVVAFDTVDEMDSFILANPNTTQAGILFPFLSLYPNFYVIKDTFFLSLMGVLSIQSCLMIHRYVKWAW